MNIEAVMEDARVAPLRPGASVTGNSGGSRSPSSGAAKRPLLEFALLCGIAVGGLAATALLNALGYGMDLGEVFAIAGMG